MFQVTNYSVEVFEIRPNQIKNIDFLTEIRKKYPDLIIQGIFAKFVLSNSHIKKILQISLESKKIKICFQKRLKLIF